MESTDIKDIQIKRLTKLKMNKYIDEFLFVDKNLNGTLEKWNLNNFLLDLPRKWQLSFYANLDGKVVGYIICSKKEYRIHIHRIAICKEYQRMNLGYSLIETLKKNISSNKIITLKVKKFNSVAIKFYEKNGFVRYGEEGCNYLYKKYSGDYIDKKNTSDECAPR